MVHAMSRTSSPRKPAALAVATASKRSRPSRKPAERLPLDDRSCPLREVAVLGEVDSGYRWDEA